MILANPPYIAAGDPALQDPALRHEPRSALVSGATGLEALAAIVRDAPRHLLPEGVLLLEHGANQAAEVTEMLVSQGFAHVRCHPDLAGLSRLTEARRL
jgi:release factor glutamine methyltransferase